MTMPKEIREAVVKALREAAADTRARGDVGKEEEGGITVWDYLNWRADRIEKEAEPRVLSRDEVVDFAKRWDARVEAGRK